MEQVIAHRRPAAGKGGHHGIGEIAVAAPGDADHHAGEGKRRCAADAEGDQKEGDGHPDGGGQDGLPSADVGGQISRQEYRGQIAPGGQRQQKARPGIADAVDLPQEGHQIAHEHGGGAADKKREQSIANQAVFLMIPGCFHDYQFFPMKFLRICRDRSPKKPAAVAPQVLLWG